MKACIDLHVCLLHFLHREKITRPEKERKFWHVPQHEWAHKKSHVM